MPDKSYEIRICDACGLRYPLLQDHPFGPRCPACMAETRVALRRPLVHEPGPASARKTKKERRKEEKRKEEKRKEEKRKEEKRKEEKRKEEGGKRIAVLMDNIRSGWNVGSILRSADGFGFTQAFLCGITPTADNEAVIKTSLGAEETMPWSYHKDAVRLVKGLKAEGWKTYALEEDPRASALSQFTDSRSPDPAVLILGSEVTGVDPELLDLCDRIFFIPMAGAKTSFNVAIAFGIAAYALSARPSRT